MHAFLHAGLEEHSSQVFELYVSSIIEAYRIAAKGTPRNFSHQRRNIFLFLISIVFI